MKAPGVIASLVLQKSPGGGVSGYTERSPKWVVGVNRGAGPWAKELASFVRSRDFGCTWNGPTRYEGCSSVGTEAAAAQ